MFLLSYLFDTYSFTNITLYQNFLKRKTGNLRSVPSIRHNKMRSSSFLLLPNAEKARSRALPHHGRWRFTLLTELFLCNILINFFIHIIRFLKYSCHSIWSLHRLPLYKRIHRQLPQVLQKTDRISFFHLEIPHLFSAGLPPVW